MSRWVKMEMSTECTTICSKRRAWNHPCCFLRPSTVITCSLHKLTMTFSSLRIPSSFQGPFHSLVYEFALLYSCFCPPARFTFHGLVESDEIPLPHFRCVHTDRCTFHMEPKTACDESINERDCSNCQIISMIEYPFMCSSVRLESWIQLKLFSI